MSFGGGGACYWGKIAVAVTFGGRGRRRYDPRGARCTVLLRHGEEGGQGVEGWQHQAGTKDTEARI